MKQNICRFGVGFLGEGKREGARTQVGQVVIPSIGQLPISPLINLKLLFFPKLKFSKVRVIQFKKRVNEQ